MANEVPGDRLTLCLGPPTRRPALGDTIAPRHFLIYRRVSPADNAQFLHTAYRPCIVSKPNDFRPVFASLGKKFPKNIFLYPLCLFLLSKTVRRSPRNSMKFALFREILRTNSPLLSVTVKKKKKFQQKCAFRKWTR